MTYPRPLMNDLIEPVLTEIKAELEALDIFGKIDDGEGEYTGKGHRAMVMPGRDVINVQGNRMLRHRVTIYVVLITNAPGATPTSLRKELNPAYDALMQDIRHKGTCFSCFPSLWYPGFIAWGKDVQVGILSQWETEIHQTFNI